MPGPIMHLLWEPAKWWEPVPASARSPVTTRVPPSQIQQVGGSHLYASQVLPQCRILPYWSGLPIVAGAYLHTLACTLSAKGQGQPAQWEFAAMR